MTRATSNERATIALAAGGTGGHVFPAEALARELLGRGHGVVLYTDDRGARYTQALEGIPHRVLPARSLAGGLAGKASAALTIVRAAWTARRDMQRRGVAALVGFGGYPSFAPALAARSLGLALLLHEQGLRLSMANRQLLRFADGLATSFDRVEGTAGVEPARVTLTGNPVRASILAARGDYPRLDGDARLRLLVVGGSQSAQVFGDVVPAALLLLPEGLRQRLQVSLQYRGEDVEAIASRLHAAGIEAEIRPFFDDMGKRLHDAHLVVTRAGATTIADLLTVGRPAIFVPIPHGGSRAEQLGNAEALAAAGAGWCVPESTLSAEALAARLEALLGTGGELARAAAAATALARPDAAARLADVVEMLVTRRRRAS